jgi:hypothetical protein
VTVDVLVVGGGTAGLRAALAAKQAGARVALLSKTHPLRSHSVTSPGGFNAALDADDSWEQHLQDTFQAGDALCERESLGVMCREAGPAGLRLDHWGVPFTRNGAGKLARRQLRGLRSIAPSITSCFGSTSTSSPRSRCGSSRSARLFATSACRNAGSRVLTASSNAVGSAHGLPLKPSGSNGYLDGDPRNRGPHSEDRLPLKTLLTSRLDYGQCAKSALRELKKT